MKPSHFRRLTRRRDCSPTMTHMFLVMCLFCVANAGRISAVKSEHHAINVTSPGWFTSPNYPGDYPDNTDIVWTFRAPQGHVVQLIIYDFQLAEDPEPAECNDYFKVHDGTMDDIKHQIYSRCGSKETWQNHIESRIYAMTVTFVSDGSNAAKGFNISYDHTPYEEEFLLAADHSQRNILEMNLLRQWSGAVFNKSGAGPLVGELEFDPVENRIYFTDAENQSLWRINLDGSAEEMLIESQLHTVSGLTLNPRSRNMYFISRKDIIVSGLDGELRYKIGTGTERTKDLATDYVSSYLFWASGHNTAAKIVRTDGDGGNKNEHFVTSDLGDLRGLTVGYGTDGTVVLYACDYQLSRILRINTDGTGRQEVHAPQGAIRNPFDVAVDSSGSIYWTETSSYGLEVLDEMGNYHKDMLIDDLKRNLTGLAIYSSTVQTPDQCDGACEPGELCLPVPFNSQACIPVLPTISNCPNDINKTTDVTPTPVTWDEPDADWPRPTTPHVQSSKKPDSLFDVGTTEVIYTFTDGLGNRANCTFDVTVIKATKPNVGIPVAIGAGAFLLGIVTVIAGAGLYKCGKRAGRNAVIAEAGRAGALEAGNDHGERGRRQGDINGQEAEDPGIDADGAPLVNNMQMFVDALEHLNEGANE